MGDTTRSLRCTRILKSPTLSRCRASPVSPFIQPRGADHRSGTESNRPFFRGPTWSSSGRIRTFGEGKRHYRVGELLDGSLPSRPYYYSGKWVTRSSRDKSCRRTGLNGRPVFRPIDWTRPRSGGNGTSIGSGNLSTTSG